MRFAFLVAATVLLAGCVNVTAPSESASEAVTRSTLFVAPDGVFADTLEAATMPLPWSWTDYIAGTLPPTWTSAPFDHDVVILNATVSFTVTAQSPASSGYPRDELTSWWGVNGGWIDHGFFDGPDALAPGDSASATFEMHVPPGGLVMPAGATHALRLGTYYTHAADAQPLLVHIGGDDGARVELVTRPVTLADVTENTLIDAEATVQGGRCFERDVTGEEASAWFTIDVPAHAAGLVVEVTPVTATPTIDFDFSVYDAEGKYVAGSHGSADDERLELREVNVAAVGAGEWSLRVYACSPQQATLQTTVTLLERATA